MKRVIVHIIVPLIIAIIFFVNGFMSVEVLGCFSRGLIALIIASISALLALASMLIGLKTRIAKDKNSFWWVISGLIFTIPVIGLIILG
jgi:hypothetical protein